MSIAGIIILTVLATYLIISIIHTVLVAWVDSGNLDEITAARIMGGPVLWIINLIGIIVIRIKRLKKKNK